MPSWLTLDLERTAPEFCEELEEELEELEDELDDDELESPKKARMRLRVRPRPEELELDELELELEESDDTPEVLPAELRLALLLRLPLLPLLPPTLLRAFRRFEREADMKSSRPR